MDRHPGMQHIRRKLELSLQLAGHQTAQALQQDTIRLPEEVLGQELDYSLSRFARQLPMSLYQSGLVNQFSKTHQNIKRSVKVTRQDSGPVQRGDSHRVREGDTLSGIAQQHGITLVDLYEVNPGLAQQDPRKLAVDRELILPRDSTSVRIEADLFIPMDSARVMEMATNLGLLRPTMNTAWPGPVSPPSFHNNPTHRQGNQYYDLFGPGASPYEAYHREDEPSSYQNFLLGASTALTATGLILQFNEYGFGTATNYMAGKEAFYGSRQWGGWKNMVPRLFNMFKNVAYGVGKSMTNLVVVATRVAGRVVFLFGFIVSGLQLVNAIRNEDEMLAGKALLDMYMGTLTAFGGPLGVLVGGIYFVVDYTIGWDVVVNSGAGNTERTREILKDPGWSPYRMTGAP